MLKSLMTYMTYTEKYYRQLTDSPEQELVSEEMATEGYPLMPVPPYPIRETKIDEVKM